MIARTLARHDALEALEVLKVTPSLVWLARLGSPRAIEGRPGQKLARALTELGPSFIKLGQFLSTRADLLGEQLAADLSELQDRLPPFDSAAARATIESEPGPPDRGSFQVLRGRAGPPPPRSPRCIWRSPARRTRTPRPRMRLSAKPPRRTSIN